MPKPATHDQRGSEKGPGKISKLKLAVISPVRNESSHIRVTLDSMVAQTSTPDKWIIVNDGSTDSTGEIIERYRQRYDFIEHLHIPDRGYRKPATGVIESFYEGLGRIDIDRYDIVAKFDGDLKFSRNTIERILEAFHNDSMLGIAGGVRYERAKPDAQLSRVLVPRGSVGGPYKFYRVKCFNAIGGLIKRAGWDGVDVVRANMLGWKTGELENVSFEHLKPTGSADGEGLRKACEKYGDVSYYMGGHLWYFALRVIGRSISMRNAGVGKAMIRGYWRSMRNHEQRESEAFRAFLRRKQFDNLVYWIKLSLFKKNMPRILNHYGKRDEENQGHSLMERFQRILRGT